MSRALRCYRGKRSFAFTYKLGGGIKNACPFLFFRASLNKKVMKMRNLIVILMLTAILASPVFAENNKGNPAPQQNGKVYVVPQADGGFRTETYTVNDKTVSQGEFIGHMEGQKQWIRDMNQRPDRITIDENGQPVPMTDEMRQQEIRRGESQIDNMIQDIKSRGGIECDSRQEMKQAIMKDKGMREEYKRRKKSEREAMLWEKGMLFEKPQSVIEEERKTAEKVEPKIEEESEAKEPAPAVAKTLVSLEEGGAN